MKLQDIIVHATSTGFGMYAVSNVFEGDYEFALAGLGLIIYLEGMNYFDNKCQAEFKRIEEQCNEIRGRLAYTPGFTLSQENPSVQEKD